MFKDSEFIEDDNNNGSDVKNRNSNLDLWNEYNEDSSVQIKRILISTYTNLVHYVINNSRLYVTNVLEDQDLFSFGVEGLSEAIDRFDINVGTKFETYAIQRIRGKIIDELRKTQIKPRTNNRYEDGSPKYQVVSIDIPTKSEISQYDLLPNPDASNPDDITEKRVLIDDLIESIKELEERDRLIVTLYFFDNLNYREISDVMSITISRISQLMSRIKETLAERLIEKGYDKWEIISILV